MTWDDDESAGDRRRDPGRRASGREILLQVAGYVGLVTAVVVLVVGAVVAVTVWGVAAKPGGFAAPSASGRGAPLPPVSAAPADGGTEVGAQVEAADDPNELTGSEVAPLVEPEAEAAPVVEGDWLSVVSDATGIPARALSAYALAHISIAAEEPTCGVDWTTIAAIGAVESGHGSHGDSVLGADGLVQPKILGPALDGDGVAAIHDTDGGALDGDVTWDRAVGPMQFIPSTWAQWGADANGDGVADPSQIDDAAYAAARYLCASGPMTTPEGWRAAVFSYNHLDSYVDKVARIANGYADALG
ncbi:murein transglycosylase [Agromyces luteolus]|uniref:Transglycosylase SLT domain-containing protein n=1 Tax=Agromyces luteolus TaxID=88373 RepID=A0A7C9HPL5_9MICO|nr:lytic murein transglycosylase [Agromyces luteolus]MUN06129.1 transglycosylase SLT domain-containing protein [Agromyces luteolus]GLK28830.1 murein transglycosylase [Agromyces luteolus]